VWLGFFMGQLLMQMNWLGVQHRDEGSVACIARLVKLAAGMRDHLTEFCWIQLGPLGALH
jgi:hypothetical protein